MPPKSQRLIEIDFLRGLAIIGMVIYHIFFILDFLDISHHQLDKGIWLILARAVQIIFLTLVGTSIAISKKDILTQSKRGLKIFSLGLLISLVTFITIPDYYIKFGILHLIGLSIVLLSPLKKHRVAPLILSVIAFTSTSWITAIATSFPPAYIVGFKVYGISAALDYFPLLPWISLPLLGIAIGNFLYKNCSPIFFPPFKSQKILHPIIYIGQHSLFLYLIHVPIILITLFILQIIATAISHI